MREQKKMPIMEIFGPTIQGEGMVIGRKTMFVRTGGCDYSCSWCDSVQAIKTRVFIKNLKKLYKNFIQLLQSVTAVCKLQKPCAIKGVALLFYLLFLIKTHVCNFSVKICLVS